MRDEPPPSQISPAAARMEAEVHPQGGSALEEVLRMFVVLWKHVRSREVEAELFMDFEDAKEFASRLYDQPWRCDWAIVVKALYVCGVKPRAEAVSNA